jgi:hypothetical protein
MTKIIYEASVYSREVSYRNFKGEEKSQNLYFALDPLQLMTVIAGFNPKKVKSGNPARQGQPAAIDDAQQLTMVRDLAVQSAGTPSEDGEAWDKFEDFEDSLAGKAFLTKLASSDGDRREFSEKVILAPFRAFVGYATADPTNTDKDKQQFSKMLAELENIFVIPDIPDETMEARRVRLEAELAEMRSNPQDTDASVSHITPLPSS